MAPFTDSATFINRPIAIETDESQAKQNWSVVTLTSQTNEPNYMRDLENCTHGLCTWINSHLEREADSALENNQVVCTINIRQEYLAEDVIPELKRRLGNYEGRTMAASAGTQGGTDEGLGDRPGTGEGTYEEIRGA